MISQSSDFMFSVIKLPNEVAILLSEPYASS